MPWHVTPVLQTPFGLSHQRRGMSRPNNALQLMFPLTVTIMVSFLFLLVRVTLANRQGCVQPCGTNTLSFSPAGVGGVIHQSCTRVLIQPVSAILWTGLTSIVSGMYSGST